MWHTNVYELIKPSRASVIIIRELTVGKNELSETDGWNYSEEGDGRARTEGTDGRRDCQLNNFFLSFFGVPPHPFFRPPHPPPFCLYPHLQLLCLFSVEHSASRHLVDCEQLTRALQASLAPLWTARKHRELFFSALNISYPMRRFFVQITLIQNGALELS